MDSRRKIFGWLLCLIRTQTFFFFLFAEDLVLVVLCAAFWDIRFLSGFFWVTFDYISIVTSLFHFHSFLFLSLTMFSFSSTLMVSRFGLLRPPKGGELSRTTASPSFLGVGGLWINFKASLFGLVRLSRPLLGISKFVLVFLRLSSHLPVCYTYMGIGS